MLFDKYHILRYGPEAVTHGGILLAPSKHNPAPKMQSAAAVKMKSRPMINGAKVKEKPARTKSWSGSQTLVRGLDVLEAVASGRSPPA
jgi:hypothetical protein